MIAFQDTLGCEVAAWGTARNEQRTPVSWCFRAPACIKLEQPIPTYRNRLDGVLVTHGFITGVMESCHSIDPFDYHVGMSISQIFVPIGGSASGSRSGLKRQILSISKTGPKTGSSSGVNPPGFGEVSFSRGWEGQRAVSFSESKTGPKTESPSL